MRMADARAASTAIGFTSRGHFGGRIGPALSLSDGGDWRTSLPWDSVAHGLRGAPMSIMIRVAEPIFLATAPRGCA